MSEWYAKYGAVQVEELLQMAEPLLFRCERTDAIYDPEKKRPRA